MVLLVFPVKCKTMTETNIKISKVLCVGCSVVCPSVNVYMVFRVADNLCSSSSKAIWALLHSVQSPSCTLWLQGDLTGSSIGGQIPRHYPSFLDPPSLGRSPSSHKAEPPVAVCTTVSSLMALGWSTVLHCHSEILKGRLCWRVLSWSVAYTLRSQEKYRVTKFILMWSYYGGACANYGINYYSFYETFFRRRQYHWSVL